MLITFAPFWTAQAIPFTIDAYEPDPVESSTFTGMMGDEYATPATPMPLFVAAPAMPATCVPWPLSSTALLELHVPLTLTQLAPSALWTRPERSEWLDSTPVSTTASGTPPLDV